MSTRIFIDGAAGTTGLEIRERLAGRDEFELIVLDDAQRKNEAARKEALHEAEIAILCLPDDAAREAVKLAEGSNTRIIDASSAHRVADGWTYGFPELIGSGPEKILNAQFVSNPGCYPTGFLALVAPLVSMQKLKPDWPFTVNAVSGYSGGGNALIDRFRNDPSIAYRAYGLGLDHKHLAEMKHHAGLTQPPIFSPAVIPGHRGMIVDVPVPAEAILGNTKEHAIWDVFDEIYQDAWQTIKINDLREILPSELLLHRDQEPWDGMEIFVFANGTQARLVARLDNLGKGASGAAIQNLNIMCGLPETTGLRL